MFSFANNTDVIHTHELDTVLVNIFLTFYIKRRQVYGIKFVFTIHNIEYQGRFGEHILEMSWNFLKNILIY